MTFLKAMQRIKGGTEERAASNCYGNWNFANKYFSIACFSNKLTYSFRYLVPLLFPYSPFISVHSFLSYLGKKRISIPFWDFLLPPHQVKSGNTLFVHTLRWEVSVLYRNSVPPWVSSWRYGKPETSPKSWQSKQWRSTNDLWVTRFL